MNRERVQRIAEFMGHPGSEQGERTDAVALDLLFRHSPRLGDVADEHDKTHFLVLINRGHIEIQIAILRIENFEVSADRAAGLRQTLPVEAAQPFRELPPHNEIALETKEPARRAVHISHHALVIEQDHSLLKGLEDFFKESLFLHQPQQVTLDIRRLQTVHSLDDLVEEARFHIPADMDILIVLCTFPNPDIARQIGTVLVEAQLAACVNLCPGIRSIYRWQGKVESEEEVLAIIKTTRACYDALEAKLKELHPYEVPEIIALPAEKVQAEYARWIQGSVS